MRLDHIKRLTGTITVKTGLHIGAGSGAMEIGGMDNPIMRDPASGWPYIPGSSLKGKMRSIWEITSGKVTSNGSVQDDPAVAPDICRVFGTTKEADFGPTRIIVRDAHLNKRLTAERLHLKEDDMVPSDIIEVKYENTIDRIKGVAKNPRPLERVVPGCVFDFEILYKVFVLDNETAADCTDETLYPQVAKLLKAIEHDALGGSGSRGSGQVVISLDPVESITLSELAGQPV